MISVKNYNLDRFTTAQLAAIDPDSVNAEMQKRDYELWSAAHMYHWSPDRAQFRADLATYEAEAKQRNTAASMPQIEPAYPSFAPQTVVRSGMTRRDGSIIAKVMKEHVREKISEAVSGLASASVVADLINRVAALESRLARYEGRVASVEQRFAGQARNLRNIEAKLTGGPVERSPKLA